MIASSRTGRRGVVRLCTFLLTGALLNGCAQDAVVIPPPTYPAMSDGAALAAIADRQARITSVSAECDLELTDAKGQSVSLDGVMVAQPPGKVRLRAWKFGQAVFDLTLADGKGWVVLPESGPAAGKVDPDKMPARRISDAFDMLGPSYFRSAHVERSDAEELHTRGTAAGMNDVACDIDRATLTPRRFTLTPAGAASSELVLDRYSLTESDPDLVFPLLMTFRGDSGVVVVRVRSVELNGEVPPGAFTPPQRAKALP